jgi:hypothetical protein
LINEAGPHPFIRELQRRERKVGQEEKLRRREGVAALSYA